MAVVHIQTVSPERARRQPFLVQTYSFFLTAWLTPGHPSIIISSES